MKNTIIIGAGPAGLAAAYKLLEEDDSGKYNVTILEEEKQVGGISKTIKYKDNYMDLGGHRFFTKNSEIAEFWDSICPMMKRERISRIYYNKKFFDYPPSLNIKTLKTLGIKSSTLVGTSYLKTLVKKEEEDSLENFYINRFGKKLYNMFFESYTEKLWGIHPSQIAPDWGAQRVKGLSIIAILKNLLTPNNKKEASLIEEFYYPKYGPGEMYSELAKKIEEKGGKILYKHKVQKININNRKVVSVECAINKTKIIYPADIIISTMPIKDLICGMNNQAPRDVLEVAKELPYRDFRTVGILTKKKNNLKDCWIYIQEPNIKMGRIQIFNNWSPYMVKDAKKTVWLGLEYFCNEGDSLWKMKDDEFFKLAAEELEKMQLIEKKDILDYHCEKVKKAYPAYFGSYENFGKVRKFLDTIPNLYCIGRNGQHRYNNMDHSILTAFEAVKNIKTEKKTKANIWKINTEKEYHEEKNEANS